MPPGMHTLSRRTSLLGALFVLLLTALFAAANVHWLAANTVTYGWDRLDHLIASFVYRDILRELTPRSILAALAYSDYYPPLVHWGAVILYRLFGVSEDVAPLVNVFYLAVLLGSTFWIAAQWAAARHRVSLRNSVSSPAHSFWTGALAAALVGLFPILFAMSRYLYLDFALTALVALDLALLLASDRFRRRWPSLSSGLVLGLAFLVKWTAAAFVIGPLIYVVLRSGALPYAWRHPRALLPSRSAGVLACLCLLAGVGLFALWFALAGDVVGTLRLGWWLALPLGLLLGGVLYTILPKRRRPSLLPSSETEAGEDACAPRVHNILGAGVIAAFVIALWYLTNIEFLDYFLFTAYGREDEPFYAFGKYAGEVFNEQLGPWFSLVFVVVVLVWAWQAIGRRRRSSENGAEHGHVGVPADPHVGVRATHPLTPSPSHPHSAPPLHTPRLLRASALKSLSLSDTAWVLLLWVLVPYFIFSFRVTLAHSRFLMPFLPPFAVWMALGLMQWRPKLLRAAAIAVVLLGGAAQFALISFDELAAWRAPLQVQIGGQPLNLLANGFFIQYPSSGVTAPRYAVAPEVLAYVDAQRQPGGLIAGKEVANLGLLVNSYQVHEKHFLYGIYKDFPQVRLRELARNWSDQPAYNQLFDMDFVLVSDTHTFRTNENSQAAVQRILYDPADAFNQAFAPVREWTLPSGEHLTLYGRRFKSLEPGVAPADYQQLLALFGDRLGPGDAVVLVSPDQVYMLGLALPADAGATIAPLPLPGMETDPTAAVTRLRELAAQHRRIFLVSHNAEQADPNGEIEGWLREHMAAGNDLWAGGVRVTPFVVRPSVNGMAALPAAAWPDRPRLTAQAPTVTMAGDALVLRANWEMGATDAGSDVGQVARPTRASLQLFGPDGSLAAQEDRDITAGEQEFVLLVPRSAPAGNYRLALVLYDPATGERFPTTEGADLADLGAVRIDEAPAPAPVEYPPLRHPEDAEDEGN